MALVAYTDPQGVFSRHESELKARLGRLKNVHWRPLAVETGGATPKAAHRTSSSKSLGSGSSPSSGPVSPKLGSGSSSTFSASKHSSSSLSGGMAGSPASTASSGSLSQGGPSGSHMGAHPASSIASSTHSSLEDSASGSGVLRSGASSREGGWVVRDTLRTIPRLDLKLVPEGGVKLQQHQIPGLNNAPLVQILVVETVSLDVYRSQFRQIGKHWFATNVEVRDPTGFVVVHAINAQKDSPKAVKAVWTRLVAEFGVHNCTQLTLTSGGTAASSAKSSAKRSGVAGGVAGASYSAGSSAGSNSDWLRLQQLVQEQLTQAFQQRVDRLETEIQKLRATRDMPGWNFGAFYAVHESLASAFAAMNLLDDAHRVYEFLEGIVRDRDATEWGPLDGTKLGSHLAVAPANSATSTSANVDSAVDVEQRNALIDRVLAQQASLFDVQQSLLAKRIDLSLAMSVVPSGADTDAVPSSLADAHIYAAIRMLAQRLPALQAPLTAALGPRVALVWLLRSVRAFYARISKVHSDHLARGRGDLLLMERDYLQGLAEQRGWHIAGIMNDISLDLAKAPAGDAAADADAAAAAAADDAALDAVEDMESQESYRQAFLHLTISAVRQYESAGLHRAVLRLIAQLMLMEYHQKHWSACWQYYEQVPELLEPQAQLGWMASAPSATGSSAGSGAGSSAGYGSSADSGSTGGGFDSSAAALLEAVLQCAKRLGKRAEALALAWKLLDLPAAPLRLVELAVTEIEADDEDDDSHRAAVVEHELSRWFEPKLVPYVRADDKGYYLELRLLARRPRFPFVTLTDVVLTGEVGSSSAAAAGAASAGGATSGGANASVLPSAPSNPALAAPTLPPREIRFDASAPAETTPAGPVYRLYARTFIEGPVHLTNLTLHHRDRTTFVHRFVSEVPVIGAQEVMDDAMVVAAMRPLSSSFTAEVVLGKHHTMRRRELELRLASPRPVQSASVRVTAVDAPLQVLAERMTGQEALRGGFTSAVVRVPVLLEPNAPSLLRVRVVVEYDGGRSFELTRALDFALAVSVDLQESFRQPPRILTQFLVKPFSGVPVRFTSAELRGSRNYNVHPLGGSQHYSREMLAYSNAPISYVFAIAKCDASAPKPADSAATSSASAVAKPAPRSKAVNETLRILLTYRLVLWECQHLLRLAVEPQMTALEPYRYLLSDVLDSVGPHIDFGEYITGQRVVFGDAAAVRAAVSAVFSGMDPADAAVMADLVLGAAPADAPASSPDFAALNATVELDAPDPDARIVHYLSLSVQDSSTIESASARGCARSSARSSRGTNTGSEPRSESSSEPSSSEGRPLRYAIGEPIRVELRIHTATFQSDCALAEQAFQYEFDRLSDGWSYTGRVKGQFRGDETVVETLSLTPNRSGELTLPNVIVKPLTNAGAEERARRRDSQYSDYANYDYDEAGPEHVVVSQHANTRLLIVPDVNMLAISF